MEICVFAAVAAKRGEVGGGKHSFGWWDEVRKHGGLQRDRGDISEDIYWEGVEEGVRGDG